MFLEILSVGLVGCLSVCRHHPITIRWIEMEFLLFKILLSNSKTDIASLLWIGWSQSYSSIILLISFHLLYQLVPVVSLTCCFLTNIPAIFVHEAPQTFYMAQIICMLRRYSVTRKVHGTQLHRGLVGRIKIVYKILNRVCFFAFT